MAAHGLPRTEAIDAHRSTLHRTAFLALSALVFAYLVLRAATVPATHDEAMTYFVYVETGRFLPFFSQADAGNHVLCTFLAWLAAQAFGPHLVVLRLPSLLAYVLYVFFAWRWGSSLRHPLIRWCLWSALLAMPFLLDFFALFRGYGLAMACWSMALYSMVRLLEKPGLRNFAAVLAGLLAGTLSSLNLLSAWAMALPLLLYAAFRLLPAADRMRALLWWLVLGILPFLFLAAYARMLSEGGSLYYGLQTGLLRGTVPSLLAVLVGGRSPVLVALVMAALLSGTFAAWRAWRAGERNFTAMALLMLSMLLWLEGFGRMALHALNGTPFPEDRTALHWVLPFVLLACLALDRAAARTPPAQWLALLLLALPARSLITANLRTTAYWPEEAIPEMILRAAEQQQHGAGHMLTIGAYHQNVPCWGFGLRALGLAGQLNMADASDFPRGGQDLLLTDPARMPLPQGYRTVAVAPGGRIALSEKEQRPALELVLDTVIAHGRTDAEFVELWHPAPETVRGHAWRVELELELLPDREPRTGSLVMEVNVRGTAPYRDDQMVQFGRDPRQGRMLHALRAIPPVPADADRVVLYLWSWNPGNQGYACRGRMRVYRVKEM